MRCAWRGPTRNPGPQASPRQKEQRAAREKSRCGSRDPYHGPRFPPWRTAGKKEQRTAGEKGWCGSRDPQHGPRLPPRPGQEMPRAAAAQQ
ncbi:hypothetical protein NDU88_005175 [Pleurodeles waltl]|uniref:Uncharacterized protein n=1 Tax=Pleurodeles waltl TaxID=8319 RepID=A0AAV7MWP1_PLEWA|nr:hypothetical protein NDU88_005175 [Pleurodeles waltl]